MTRPAIILTLLAALCVAGLLRGQQAPITVIETQPYLDLSGVVFGDVPAQHFIVTGCFNSVLWPGEQIVYSFSPDLVNWQPVVTNTATYVFQDTFAATNNQVYCRVGIL